MSLAGFFDVVSGNDDSVLMVGAQTDQVVPDAAMTGTHAKRRDRALGMCLSTGKNFTIRETSIHGACASESGDL